MWGRNYVSPVWDNFEFKGRVCSLFPIIFLCYISWNPLYSPIAVNRWNAPTTTTTKIRHLWQPWGCKKPVQSFHSAWMKLWDGLPTYLHALCQCTHCSWPESSTWLGGHIAVKTSGLVAQEWQRKCSHHFHFHLYLQPCFTDKQSKKREAEVQWLRTE